LIRGKAIEAVRPLSIALCCLFACAGQSLVERLGHSVVEVLRNTAMGVDPSTIRNLEKGRAGIEQIERVIKLCKALDCNVEDLIEHGTES
jgi:DNA-binding Xre family transcriptional regulator